MADIEDTRQAPKKRRSIDDHLKALKERSSKAVDDVEQRQSETPKQMFLPGFDIGAMPNHLNRSSLIAPVARGRRKFHRQTVMVTRSDCVLEYTGEQLDEADADILMALIYFAQPYKLGEPVPMNRAQMLRKIGRSTGKTQYVWLHKAMKRLREGVMFLEARKPDGSTRYRVGKMVSFNIVKDLDYDEDSGEMYTYTLDPRWMTMFGNREFALLDWDKRMQIGRGQDMAKTLQRLVATSSNPVQRYSLDWLKDKMEYGGRVRDFRDAIIRAVAELVRLDIVVAGEIEDSTRGAEQLALTIKTPSA